jgi:hypothetical protein
MTERESKLAERQSVAAVADKASATDIGANLSVLSPESDLPFGAAGLPEPTAVLPAEGTARVAEPGCPDKSLPTSDDGVSRGGCGVGKASRIRNRSSRISMTTDSARSGKMRERQRLTSICGPEAFTKASSPSMVGESLVLVLVAHHTG